MVIVMVVTGVTVMVMVIVTRVVTDVDCSVVSGVRDVATRERGLRG